MNTDGMPGDWTYYPWPDVDDDWEDDFKCLRPSDCTAEGQLGAWCDHCEWFVTREDK